MFCSFIFYFMGPDYISR